MLNKNVYGIEGTDKDLSSSFNAYNNAAEDKKEDVAEAEAEKLGTTVKKFKEAAADFGKSTEEMRAELEANVEAAQTKVDNLLKPDSEYSEARRRERNLNIEFMLENSIDNTQENEF